MVYNKANSKNQPAPPNVSPSGEQQSEGSDEEDKFMLPTVDMDPSDAMALDDIVADDSTDNFTNNQNENVAEPTESNELTEQDESENELNLETSQTSEPATENYTVAIDTVRHSNSLLQPYIPAGNENVDLNENGQTLITRVFDDEMEMTYIYGQKLCAKKNDPYRTKENDVLSGNLPFQENVCNKFLCRFKYMFCKIFGFFIERERSSIFGKIKGWSQRSQVKRSYSRLADSN